MTGWLLLVDAGVMLWIGGIWRDLAAVVVGGRGGLGALRLIGVLGPG